ncbi:MAG: isoprenyl transferase [Persephonella sp.]|nr:MAG: isoprenyl transferase [Persephonella sp.]RUM61738.1 MAG: isoprenyl transferase [Persephonella sp.]
MKAQNLLKVPTHVSIIMDGNGRWAKRRGLPRYEGHKEGAKALEKILTFASDLGIQWLSVFAFSTENWKRPKEEIEVIMSLLVEYINTKLDKLLEKNIRLRFMGRLNQLSDETLQSIKEGEEATKECNGMNFVITLNYSGRAEIIDAINKILKDKKESISIDEFKNYLYIPEMPEPDLLIRTSGELRISNYMLWELAYTELYFTDVLWPDFNEEEFLKALYSYQFRERRFGSV